MEHKLRLVIVLVMVVIALVDYNEAAAAAAAAGGGSNSTLIRPIFRRSDTNNHNSMVHNHLSRKVFDRACAASKDTIDEIIACITENETLLKTVKPELAANCHKDSFGIDFDHKDIQKHKEMICKNREKFEDMTACIYRKLAESLDPKEMDKLAEAMVDVGLCIINALDG